MILGEVYKVKRVQNPHPVEVSVPGSKSITNRALLIAALAEGKSVLNGVLFYDDSRHFLQALIDLGFEVEIEEADCTVTVTGCGGAIPSCKEKMGGSGSAKGAADQKIYVGSAGTAARFLSAYLGLSKGRFWIDSSEQMKKRPMEELLVALEELGAVIEYKEVPFHFPFVIGCKAWAKHEVTIDVDKSSQFLSALLIVSVLSDADFTIHVAGSHGMAYVEMTVRMMEQFGVQVIRPDAATFVIPAGQHYRSMDYVIEPDLSAACYFYAMSPILKVPVKVQNVHMECMQGDIRFLNVLEDMGCCMTEERDGVRVFPPEDGVLKGGAWDLSGFSDQTLTLAAIAPFADSAVTIAHVGHIRMQECDRIQAILHNLDAIGISCREADGTITIEPGTPHGALIETYEDHRVAMAFTIPGLAVDGIEIENPSCCRKTFERYFEVLEDVLYR
jgi:3-phosphoshikimate 1-carboxyvinyltransferase